MTGWFKSNFKTVRKDGFNQTNDVVGISYEVQTSVGAEGDKYVGLGKMHGESTSLTSLGEMTLTDNGFTYPQSDLSVRKI